MPVIRRVFNLKPGVKGRNFESFTGLMQSGEGMEDSDPTRVLVKLYKRQQAKIDEAENQKQVYSIVDHLNVIHCLDQDNVSFRNHSFSYFVFPAY